MARTIATVEAELDALRAADARGILEVRFADGMTRYADGADIERRIARLERELAKLNGTYRTHRLAKISKGIR